MPCENCNVQFTFLRRKRNCSECSRFYCSQCLVKRGNNIYLCERCIIFTTRPISKVDLLKLKPKDLIFYLQSKHISTAGCVEKEELVNLVLAHINSDTDQHQQQEIPRHEYINQDSSGSGYESNCSNPFDQFKQTCQNFFTNFTGKIASDLNFETRSATHSSSNAEINILDQPRVSTREIPTYASSIHVDTGYRNSTSVPNINCNADNNNRAGGGTNDYNNTMHRDSFDKAFNNPTTNNNGNQRKTTATEYTGPRTAPNIRDINSSSSLSSPSSPIISISSLSSQSLSSQTQIGNRAAFRDHLTIPQTNNNSNMSTTVSGENNPPTTPISPNTKRILDSATFDGCGSGCECSDDEIITKFKTRTRSANNQSSGKMSPPSQTDSAFEDQIPGPSGSVGGSSLSSNSKNAKRNDGDSSGSSFEELGAVGGGSPSDTEHWQFVNKTEMNIFGENDINNQAKDDNISNSKTSSHNSNNDDVIPKDKTTFQFSTTNITNSTVELLGEEKKRPPRKMIRRRSDSSIYAKKHMETEFSQFPLVSEEESDNDDNMESLHKRQRKSCKKCGKSKKNLEKCLTKFIKQLQSTQMSREDIRKEANAFLIYLQKRESFDCSDPELSEIISNTESDSQQNPQTAIQKRNIRSIELEYGANEGIHVYAHSSAESARYGSDSRFLNIWDLNSSSEIDELSVKQLKEILMLNRVDYKGCCEKQELLERVHRLWKDLKTSPAVDKLEVDDLCKICMDAPIECVMLECGHMATCTNCGKVLSECPICRQYVVRVVRFFKA